MDNQTIRQIENSGSPRSGTESRRRACGHVRAITSAEKPRTISANPPTRLGHDPDAPNRACSSSGSGPVASLTSRALSSVTTATRRCHLLPCRASGKRSEEFNGPGIEFAADALTLALERSVALYSNLSLRGSPPVLPVQSESESLP